MLLKSSFRKFIANLLCRLFINKKVKQYYFFDSTGADCVIKFVLSYEDKILLAKQRDKSSLSKICLPYGYVDLKTGEDNATACERISFERLNLKLDGMFFDSKSLIDVEFNYTEEGVELTYVYNYNLSKEEFNKISESYIFYDFFLLDLEKLNKYEDKNKNVFVSKLDYDILKKLKEGAY
ncbi:MAG: hypothetical protein GY793_03865 [Proteobacteria bacterium]|nr:hypothetical protein [Pseudomonadota bacterium]